VSGLPLVTAIIPAFNAARTLRSAADSVLRQTLDDLELVIVDDGSFDETPDLALRIEDRRVRVVRQANAGAAAARNTGIEQSRGRWVAFLDADDLWLPQKLVRQIEAMRRSGSDVAQAGVISVNDELQSLEARLCTPSGDPLMDFLRFRNMPAVMETLIASRSRLEAIGGFSSDLVILEDWDIMIRLARSGGVLNMTEPLALYRVHAGSRSRDLSIHIEPGHLVLQRLFADPHLPERVRRREREVYGRFYTMLAGGAYRIRDTRELLHWSVKAVRTDPRMLGYMAGLPLRRIQRWRSRRSLAATVLHPVAEP
jgi:glycosyltransferase involved in cell wall biosynthesis